MLSNGQSDMRRRMHDHGLQGSAHLMMKRSAGAGAWTWTWTWTWSLLLKPSFGELMIVGLERAPRRLLAWRAPFRARGEGSKTG